MSQNSNLKITKNANGINVALIGSLTYKSNKKILTQISKAYKNSGDIYLDLENLNELDYFMAVSIYNIVRKSKKELKILNSNKKFDSVFALIDDEKIDFDYLPKNYEPSALYELGKYLVNGFSNFLNLLAFFGEFLVKILKLIFNPKKFRIREITNHFKDAGIDSLFIVGLTSFLIGVVLAYIGSNMLSQFGASIYVIDIMGMMTLRETGPLIAAIVVAGRSASSFTAQIGVMKLTEEVDAMKTMGFDPFYFLVMPRVLAMIIATPFIIFLADMISIIGQMIVCNFTLDITYLDFLERFKENVDIQNFIVGIFKAPFFGAAIAIIGCLRGFEISGDTESVGKFTTLSVVNAIFWVIALDAIFAIIFSELGI